MAYDLSAVPFSRFGAYLAVSQLWETSERPGGLWLRHVHGDASTREVFHLEVLVDGQSVPFTPVVSPAELVLDAGMVRVRLCIAGDELLRVHGEGAGLRLTARQGHYNCATPRPGHCWDLNMASALRNYLLVPLHGEVRVDAPWEVMKCQRIVIDLLPTDGVMDAALEQGIGSWNPADTYPDYAACVAQNAEEFRAFAAPYLDEASAFSPTAEQAALLNWMTTVSPNGCLTRHTMFMSKNWMTNVWSWDHAFNALALSPAHPELAWEQLHIMFDHQLPTGQLPDLINDNQAQYNFVKPPVHGWIFREMQRENDWFRAEERIAEFYEPLCRWTEWWFAYRDPAHEGLPQHHHGNDSGWDNATVFDVGLPVKGVDLTAYLTVQMEVLAEMAQALGKSDEAAQWAKRADAQCARLLDGLWDGARFRTPSALTGGCSEGSDSLFNCLPIILGERLPAAVRASLVGHIRHYLTEWGLATEHPDSPLYMPDGYWRGPIWGPPTLIITDGLRRIGETELADDIALRYCRLCQQSGFAENFNALTGAPQCDRAYTWTASVFLTLYLRYKDSAAFQREGVAAYSGS